jgi:hypothetical protein
MRRIGLLPGLLAGTVLVLAAACDSSTAGQGSGPLGWPGNPSTQCFGEAQPGHADTDGVQDFMNTGRNTIVIDRVTLASARHLRLVGAYTVPGRYLVGAWNSFPPPASELDKGVKWAERRRPAGTRVLPGHWVDIVVGVAPTSQATGRSAGIKVLYHADGTSYALQSRVQIVIKVRPAQCS